MQNTAIYLATTNQCIPLKYKEIKYTYDMNCLIGDYSTLFGVTTMRPLSGPVSWRWHSANHNVPLWNATTYIHIYIAHSTGEDKSYINFELQKTIELQYFVLNWACLTNGLLVSWEWGGMWLHGDLSNWIPDSRKSWSIQYLPFWTPGLRFFVLTRDMATLRHILCGLLRICKYPVHVSITETVLLK